MSDNEIKKTAEEYRAEAEKYRKQLKEYNRTFIKTGAIMAAVLAVVFIASVAWFASNSNVSSSGVNITVNGKSIELRTYGSDGIHDDILKKVMSSGEEDNFWYIFSKILGLKNETSAEKYSINWLLKDDSNVGNYSNASENWEEYWKNQNNDRQDYAIEPGSKGEISFYVVPKYSGEVNLTLNLSLIPYKANENGYKEISENSFEKDFIDGHILFFLLKENDEKKELTWLDDGSFNITIDDAVSDAEYKYTLFWCWPQTFAEIIMKSGDIYLNGRDVLFSEFNNGEDVRKQILYSNENFSMIKYAKRYFYSNLSNSPLSNEKEEIALINSIYNKLSVELTTEQQNAFIELSSYYNQADQYIGSHIDCVRIRLVSE